MLYLDHFGLDEPPFRITPHTDFFFDGADRGATLDALLYAILHDEGIVKVSGEVGSGKTMLCRVLMERLPKHVEIVYLANPSLARDEILHTIADDLKAEFSKSRITLALRELEEHLVRIYASGRRVVILIDEAHAMPEETLEQVRLLSNLESNRHKLLQIVLFGQTELDSVLDKISMRQLKDRITHSFRMRPLSEPEVGKYLSFRMRAAGYRGPDVFSTRAVKMIAKAASGLTRRVNILADKALLAAFTENKHAVTERQARVAIRDSEFGRLLHEKRHQPVTYAVAALGTGLALGVALHWGIFSGIRPPEPVAAPPQPATAVAAPVTAPAPTPVDTQSQAKDVATGALTPPSATTEPTPPQKSGEDSANSPKAPRPLATGSQAVRQLLAYKSGPNPLLKERLATTRERLEREPDGSYSIELFATENSDANRVERFLTRAKELVQIEEVLVIPQVSGSHYRIRVAFGTFPDRDTAQSAADRLPPKYKQSFHLELRNFKELRTPP